MRWVLLGLFLLSLSPTARAEPSATDKRFAEAHLAILQGRVDADGRQSAAAAAAAMCKKFAAAIPTLSPRESEWLDAEIAASRIVSIMQTVEMSKRVAGQSSRHCVSLSETIASGSKAIEIEMAMWSRLAVELLDRDFHWHVNNLVRSKTISLADDEVKVLEFAPSFGRAIVERIIAPYLEQRAR